MRMVSGFRNKEEHKTEPTGRKDRGGSVFHSSAAAKRPAAQLTDGVDVIMVMVIVEIRISKMFCKLAARHRSSGQTGVHTGLIECQRIERSKHTKIWKDRYVIFTVAVAVRGDVNDQGNMEVWTSIHNGFCVFRHTAV